VQIPFVQPPVAPPQPPAPVAVEPVRAQAIEPARQVTASRSGGEGTGKDRARTGDQSPEQAQTATRSRRGQLLDLFI
jgi:hypothetical protein